MRLLLLCLGLEPEVRWAGGGEGKVDRWRRMQGQAGTSISSHHLQASNLDDHTVSLGKLARVLREWNTYLARRQGIWSRRSGRSQLQSLPSRSQQRSPSVVTAMSLALPQPPEHKRIWLYFWLLPSRSCSKTSLLAHANSELCSKWNSRKCSYRLAKVASTDSP